MFERFTDRARKCMALANQEAMKFNHECIGPEHTLLGLLKEGNGVAANALKNLGVDLAKLREETLRVNPAGDETVTMGRLPQTPKLKRALEFAIEEARNLNNNYVGTEHLLLGLCREGEVATLLLNFGVDVDSIRKHISGLLGEAVRDIEMAAPFRLRFIDAENRIEVLAADGSLIDQIELEKPFGWYLYNAAKKHETSQQLLRDLKGFAENVHMPPKSLTAFAEQVSKLIQRIDKELD